MMHNTLSIDAVCHLPSQSAFWIILAVDADKSILTIGVNPACPAARLDASSTCLSRKNPCLRVVNQKLIQPLKGWRGIRDAHSYSRMSFKLLSDFVYPFSVRNLSAIRVERVSSA